MLLGLSRNLTVFSRRCTNIRSISTTQLCSLDQKYRQEKGLPLNPNAESPLTDLPDYTFLDGRPTPLGMRQKRRIQKQRDIAMKIITLSKEIDFAVELHDQKLRNEQLHREKLLSNKLKQKGHLLKDGNYD